MITCHLPLQVLDHVLLYLLIFNIPLQKFRVENRNEALCPLGKTVKTGLQIDVLGSQFYKLNSCISLYLEKH